MGEKKEEKPQEQVRGILRPYKSEKDSSQLPGNPRGQGSLSATDSSTISNGFSQSLIPEGQKLYLVAILWDLYLVGIL